MNSVPVTVILLTYRSDLAKTFMTLKSVVSQIGIDYQLIIADDGSDNNYFSEISEFLDSKGFYDYSFVANQVNQGTVKNVISGVSRASGKYVKLISPGDCFSGKSALKNWVQDIEKKGSSISFCDAVYYQIEDDQAKVIREKAFPQDIDSYREGGKRLRETYLLANDVCIGADTLVKTVSMFKYLNMIDGKVTYAEDAIYRLMIYCNESVSWFEGAPVLYEYGSGISTSNSEIWKKRLLKDWNNTNAIIVGWMRGDSFDKKLQKVMESVSSNNSLVKAEKYFCVPGLVGRKIRRKVMPRLTPMLDDLQFIDSLIQ